LHPLNLGIFPKNQKFGTEGQTERFLTFLIFQIPPEKIVAIMVMSARVCPLLKTCALSARKIDGSKTEMKTKVL